MKPALCLCAALTLWPTGPAFAQQVNLEGYFIAASDCEATIRRGTGNPGNVRLEPSRAYRTLARNDTPGTHYRIEVPGAPENEARWVAMGCGAFAPEQSLVRAPGAGGAAPRPAGAARLAPDSIEAVLAASWQPGFCATPAGRDKAECAAQNPGRHDATHFALHGLWPDDLDDRAIFPCYCDRGAPVSCREDQPPEAALTLAPAVASELAIAMPGMQSGLHLHEWTKHGACYEDDRSGADAGADPDEYFGEAMALLTQLNGSAVQRLFAANLGKVVTRQAIEAAFDGDFGPGTGERVIVRCFRVRGENLITELWIGLAGPISAHSDLGDLIRAAPAASSSSSQRSCNSGRVLQVQ